VGSTDKIDGFKRLDALVRRVQSIRRTTVDFDAALQHERAISPTLDGRTVHRAKSSQLNLFAEPAGPLRLS
jgi:hypothetical protein